MKKVFRRILAVGMTFVLLASAGCSKKKNSSIEGSGYDSPEKAALAFAEAFKKQDTDKMLSTFAIETYCENYNTSLNMVRMTNLNISMLSSEPISPQGDSYLSGTNTYNRAGDIALKIEYLYAHIIASNADADVQEICEEIFDGRAIKVTESEYMEKSRAFLDTMTGVNDLDIKVGEVYNAEALLGNYYAGRNFQNYYIQGKIRNADGYRSLAVSLTVDEQEILVTMDTIKYGKKWYVANLGGLLSNQLGRNYASVGYISAEELEEMGLLANTEKTEKKNRKEIEDLENDWADEHEQYMEEYEALTEDLSKEEIDELIYGDDWRMDPRCNVYSLSYDEMLEFFDIDLD